MIMNHLEPTQVWHAFEEISRIPRGDDNLKKVAEYIYIEAKSHGMACHIDSHHNVLIWLPASPGREKDMPVTVQAHMYMLGVKTDESDNEFEEDGIELMVDGDELWANGTTLGADDGIGVAMMMALFRDNELSHPELELCFSAVEGKSFDKNQGFEKGHMKHRRHIKLDYDEDGIKLSGNAGIMVSHVRLPIEKDLVIQGESLHVKVDNVTGCNAIKILGRLLTEVKDESVLVDLRSDQHFNLIPTSAEAVIVSSTPELTMSKLMDMFGSIKCEECNLDTATMDIEQGIIDERCFGSEDYDKIMALIALTPIVSNTLYSLVTEDNRVTAGNMTRYSHQSLGKNYCDRLYYLGELLGGEVIVEHNMLYGSLLQNPSLLK